MILTATSIVHQPLAWIILGAIVLWLFGSMLVAAYAHDLGYPWFPLFLAGMFLGFPLVLLGVVIGYGPDRDART